MSQYQFVKDVEVCLRNHEVYHSKEEIREQMEEIRKGIALLKMRLFGMVCSNIKELYPSDEDGSYLEKAQEEFNNIFEEEDMGLVYLLQHLVDLQYIHDNFERVEIG